MDISGVGPLRTLAFSIVLLVMAAGVATAQQVQQLDLRLYPQADSVNVRSTPSTSSTVLGQVNQGDAINVTGLVGDWYRVAHPPGRTGYILATLLAATRPGDVFRDIAEGPEMVVIPAGRFTMGAPANEVRRWRSFKDDAKDEGPQHKVTIGRSFAVGKYEVTFAEWDACVSAGGCLGYRPADEGWGRGTRPVTNVSWEDAKAYVAWLSQRTGQQYRLLTESEWEYAARAGTTTRYWWGNDIGRGNANCNICDSPWDDKQAAPVGSFKPNAFGLHDMLGNVWEWAEDCWHDSYTGAPTDGTAWTANCTAVQYAVAPVMRGGSWNHYEQSDSLRSAYRIWGPSDYRHNDIGFRVARTLSAPAPDVFRDIADAPRPAPAAPAPPRQITGTITSFSASSRTLRLTGGEYQFPPGTSMAGLGVGQVVTLTYGAAGARTVSAWTIRSRKSQEATVTGTISALSAQARTVTIASLSYSFPALVDMAGLAVGLRITIVYAALPAYVGPSASRMASGWSADLLAP